MNKPIAGVVQHPCINCLLVASCRTLKDRAISLAMRCAESCEQKQCFHPQRPCVLRMRPPSFPRTWPNPLLSHPAAAAAAAAHLPPAASITADSFAIFFSMSRFDAVVTRRFPAAPNNSVTQPQVRSSMRRTAMQLQAPQLRAMQV